MLVACTVPQSVIQGLGLANELAANCSCPLYRMPQAFYIDEVTCSHGQAMPGLHPMQEE